MTEALHVYLASDRVVCRREIGLQWKPRIVELPTRQWSVDDLESLEFAIPESERAGQVELHVYLGSALCKFMVVDLPVNAWQRNEQVLIAQACMQRHLGLIASGWGFALDVDAASRNGIACAVRRNLMARIQALASTHGLKLRSMKPYVGAIWNAFAAQTQGKTSTQVFLAVEHDAFTVFVANSGALKSVNAMPHNGEYDAIDREIRRVGLSFGAEMDDCVTIAAPKREADIAGAKRSKILSSKGSANLLHADFRDLLIRPQAEV